MASFGRRAAAVATAAFALTLPQSASAYEEGANPPPAVSDGSAITVTLVRVGGTDIVTGISGGGGSGSSDPDACVPRLVPVPLDTDLPALGLPAVPAPGASAYWLFCGDALVQGLWLLPEDVVDVDALAASTAERHVETILAPALALDTNPPAGAVTGLPTHLWVSGWDGAPIDVPPVEALGQRVDVRLWLDRVEWTTGDGTTVTADLGRVWPEPSTVTHTYTDVPAGGATTVAARVVIGAEYRYGGGAPIPLAPLVVERSLDLPVRQIQAVIG